MQKIGVIWDKTIKCFVYGVLALTFLIVVIAIFENDVKGEANIGSFDSRTFNEGWELQMNGVSETISLPLTVSAKPGDILIVKNTLPNDLNDGCSLLSRASMQDLYIYINGELRRQYASESVDGSVYYIPSAYVVAELSSEDAGAEIEIRIRVKSQGKINEVKIGNGNNVWFDILKESMPTTMAVSIVLLFGIILAIVSKIMGKVFDYANRSFYLGLLMMDMGIWVISESAMRQIVFAKPSLSQYFAYLSVELLGVIAAMYFDEVQYKRYHKRYVIIETLITGQLVINMILQLTGIAEFYETLLVSHLWLAIGIVLGVVNTIADIRSKEIQKYKVTALGMVGFLFMSGFEIVAFYITRFSVFGIYVSIGLVVLMITTVIQTLMDLKQGAEERESRQTAMIVKTIETIAGAIDAKDEYTGGHSERVGQYALILAREVAEEYGFTEEDLMRIHYIGIMHDIGKIGVADTVLNKTGRLTECEYGLMKKHVEIGSEMMAGMGESIEGLVDGIRYHHERYDGLGYPEGLAGEEIPLIARILCLADSYDAMTSNRVYRNRLTDEEVRPEFVKSAGKQFDPALTKVFVNLIDNGKMHPYTVGGMATTEKGTILKSEILESRLQVATDSEDINIKNPEHVRMLCFIMKLKENKEERMDVFFVRRQENTLLSLEQSWDKIDEMIKLHMKMKDIKIECSDNLKLVALFDKTDAEIENFEKELSINQDIVYFEHL